MKNKVQELNKKKLNPRQHALLNYLEKCEYIGEKFVDKMEVAYALKHHYHIHEDYDTFMKKERYHITALRKMSDDIRIINNLAETTRFKIIMSVRGKGIALADKEGVANYLYNKKKNQIKSLVETLNLIKLAEKDGQIRADLFNTGEKELTVLY